MERRKSRYRGIIHLGSNKWRAFVSVQGRYYHVAQYNDEREAAYGRDRAALHLNGPGVLLNFPDRKVEPATIEQLRAESATIKRSRMSQYLGVFRLGPGRFVANIGTGGRSYNLGMYDDEREAARIRDRAALYLRGRGPWLNFPNDSSLRPENPDKLRRQSHSRYKASTTSRFLGVCWHSVRRAWTALVYLKTGPRYIALYDTEEEAAIAHDRASLHFHCARAKLNFPRRRLAPASIDQLRYEAYAPSKETSVKPRR